MNQPKLFRCTLTGPGASGKSTAMRIMAKALRENGFNVCVCEGGHVFEPFQPLPEGSNWRVIMDTKITE